MDKQQARDLIKKTFEQPFEKARFTVFIKNLLNKIDESKAFHARGDVKESFKNVVKTYERIGSYNSPSGEKLDIIIVYLQKTFSIHHARVTQRNFAGKYLTDRGQKDAGLFAFVSPDDTDWRFSLVKMDYKFEETATGKIKVKEEFTPARRWSFLVGTNEKSHTAQSRLVNILADDEQSPTLAELEEAFNIETVTKEFFLQYRDLFIRAKEALDKVVKSDARINNDFKGKGVNTVDFAKKLLGQIVFLYFLQKKGWFGAGRDATWGTGSKQFLRELFEGKHGSYSNFFDDILEPLFYEALRNDRSHDDDYYSRFHCKIPFLNGGLFDPIGDYDWVHTEINLPNNLFSNKNKTAEGDIGDGILDIFDRYNFTVKEDEPLEKEVAIDPELLGKAYEKFNAIRPDNFEEYKKALTSGKKGDESKFNKQFGVYYTPREIVHYMCQQSLINYLHTELNQEAVAYETLGAKQYNMFGNKGKKGQLDLTVEHRSNPTISKEDIETLIHLGEHVSENEARVENNGKETSAYSYKLHKSIRKNAQLIDRRLADITVCDPAVGSGAFPVGMMSEIVRTRTVLSTFINEDERTPYNFKRRCIEHSLYGVDIDPGAVEIAKLRLWLSLVVDEDDIANIKPLPNLDYKIVCGNSLLGYPYTPIGLEKIEELKAQFLIQVNPKLKQKLRRHIDDAIYGLFKNTGRSLGYNVTMDFRINFSEVFHRTGGFDVVIANPPYVFGGNKGITEGEKKIFKKLYLSGTSKINLFAIFIERGMTLLKDNGFLTYITPNTLLRVTSYSNIRKYIVDETCIMEVMDLGAGIFDEVTASTVVISLINKKPDSNHLVSIKVNLSRENCNKKRQAAFANPGYVLDIFSTDLDERIISKVKSNTINLGTLAKYIRFGVVITKNINDVVSYKKINPMWKPFLEGDEIGAYVIRYSGRYLRYQKEMLHRSRTPEIFESRKIMIQRITGGQRPLKAVYDDESYYNKESIINLILLDDDAKEYKYILGLLNSTLMNWMYNKLFTNESKLTVNLSKEYLSELPIKQIRLSDKNAFVNIVDSILTIKHKGAYSENPKEIAEIKALEKNIDRFIYDFYGLTQDEIKIVEGGS